MNQAPSIPTGDHTPRILAVDIGTSSVKAAILEVETGTPVGPIARHSYPIDHPTANASEVPAERIWKTVLSAVREVTEFGPSQTVSGIGFSSLTPALVLVGAHGEPIAPIWLHSDRRSIAVANRVWNEVGPEFHQDTGNRPLPGGMSAMSYRKLIDETPELKSRIRHYFHLNGWLGYKLTGEKATDSANASFTGLFSTLNTGDWSSRWCDYFDVDRSWLPPVISGEQTLGKLRAHAASELGLPEGIAVKIGTADTSSAMLAADLKEGELLHVMGTTQVLATKVAHPACSNRRLVRRLGIGDSFVHVTHNPVGGGALEWIRQLCFAEKPDSIFFDTILRKALDHSTSVRLDPPFLGGDRLEIELATASFQGLTLATDRHDLLRALLTAMQNGHTEALEALGLNGPVKKVYLTGGAAKAVRRILPGYSGRYLSDPEVETIEEGSLRGVARLFRSR